MDKFESLSHTAWDCKYHVVFIPNVGAERCTGSFASIWAKCSASSRRSGSVESKKGT